MTEPRSKIYDVELPVTVVVGRKEISLEELSSWSPDKIVPLKAQVDQPVELCINGKLVATGELCEGEDGPDSLAVRILDIKKNIDE